MGAESVCWLWLEQGRQGGRVAGLGRPRLEPDRAQGTIRMGPTQRVGHLCASQTLASWAGFPPRFLTSLLKPVRFPAVGQSISELGIRFSGSQGALERGKLSRGQNSPRVGHSSLQWAQVYPLSVRWVNVGDVFLYCGPEVVKLQGCLPSDQHFLHEISQHTYMP